MCWWNFDNLYSLSDCLESAMRGLWGLYFAKEMCWWVRWNFDIPCTECLLWTIGGQWEGSNKYRSCTSPKTCADGFDGILIFCIIVWWLSVCQSGVRRFKYKYSFCALPRKSDDGFDGILILRTVWSLSGVTHQRPQTPTIQSRKYQIAIQGPIGITKYEWKDKLADFSSLRKLYSAPLISSSPPGTSIYHWVLTPPSSLLLNFS